MWVFYNFQPIVVNAPARQGLSFDLARLLADNSEGAFSFHVEVLPRRRLNNRLAEGLPGMVFWANNAWFGDREKTNYLWSGAVIDDWNVVISLEETPVDYTGPHSLFSMTLTGIAGHRYQGLEMLIEGRYMRRSTFNGEGQVIRFIGIGWGDVAIPANSAAQHYTRLRA